MIPDTAAKLSIGKDDQAFKLVSVTTSKAPAGEDSRAWCRYVITQGENNTIVGHRQGSVQSVSRALKDMIGLMNLRRSGKVGRVHLTPSRKSSS